MEMVLTVLGWLVGLFGIGLVVKHLTETHIISRRRRRLESEIHAMADDLTTNPEGLSLRDAIDLLEIERIEELVVELRKMPAGSRSLQRAIEITGDENYVR